MYSELEVLETFSVNSVLLIRCVSRVDLAPFLGAVLLLCCVRLF